MYIHVHVYRWLYKGSNTRWWYFAVKYLIITPPPFPFLSNYNRRILHSTYAQFLYCFCCYWPISWAQYSYLYTFMSTIYFQSYNSFPPMSIYCAYCLFMYVQFSCCPLRALNWSINWIELNWISPNITPTFF